MHAAKISPYSKIFQKRIIKKNKKIKILVAAHCFLDSPHVLGNFLFPDFMHWLNFLAEVSKKTNYDWLKTDFIENFDTPIALFIPGTSASGKYKQWQPHKFSEIAKKVGAYLLVDMAHTAGLIASKQFLYVLF